MKKICDTFEGLRAGLEGKISQSEIHNIEAAYYVGVSAAMDIVSELIDKATNSALEELLKMNGDLTAARKRLKAEKPVGNATILFNLSEGVH